MKNKEYLSKDNESFFISQVDSKEAYLVNKNNGSEYYRFETYNSKILIKCYYAGQRTNVFYDNDIDLISRVMSDLRIYWKM